MKTIKEFLEEKLGEELSLRSLSALLAKDLMEEYAKQLLEEYTNRIVEKVKLEITEDGQIKKSKTYKANIDYLSEIGGDLKVKVNKESIISQLEPFIKSLQ